MVQEYAKIDMTNPGSGIGTVVNIQMIDPEVDALDPDFTWVALTDLYCSDGGPIQNGCTYDGENFHSI